MNRKTLIFVIIILTLVLAGELVFVGYMEFNREQIPSLNDPTVSQTEDTTPTDAPETEATTLPTEAPVEETEETLPTETEPEQNRYLLTFVGDCTLASASNKTNADGSFVKTIGTDYDYPFRNVAEFFRNDDFTMVNLESVLADSGYAADKTFNFRGPTAYTAILTGSSVEAVTLANNHTQDFGQEGYASTTQALRDANLPYVEKDGTLLYTTDSGLVIGVYAGCFDFDEKDMKADIAALRQQGAEIVIAALHWGNEGQYRPTKAQTKLGYAAIDAGADIVYGHHPHVLQKIEHYNNGVIFYSLGNFSFGGNHFPRDMDSVIAQVEILRDENGKVSLGELILTPVSISSMAKQNNFQPTPYAEGSEEFERAMSKLDGTFTGPDLVVDYSFLDPTESTESTEGAEGDGGESTQPPAEEGSNSGDAGSDTGADSGADSGSDAGSDAGSGESGGGDTGADTGNAGAGDSGTGDSGGDSAGGEA